MHTIMESFGECEAVENGPDAIALFNDALENEQPFDLITLDIAMPDMDGTEVLFQIRKIESEQSIPKQKQVKILMVTSHSEIDDYITCLQAGCNDYIVKPFDMETVIKKLEKIELKTDLTIDAREDIQKSSQEIAGKNTSEDSDPHY